jgi:hypothetical protein
VTPADSRPSRRFSGHQRQRRPEHKRPLIYGTPDVPAQKESDRKTLLDVAASSRGQGACATHGIGRTGAVRANAFIMVQGLVRERQLGNDAARGDIFFKLLATWLRLRLCGRLGQ